MGRGCQSGAEGRQGEPGPPGPPGPAGSGTVTLSAICDVDLKIGDCITVLNSAHITKSTTKVIGMVTVGATAGDIANYIVDGIVNGLSDLTPGATYYFDNNGGMTTTPPQSGMFTVLGTALDATTFSFNPQNRVKL